MFGIYSLPNWAYIVVTLGLTHITILCVTIYLHRHQAHRSLDLHPGISHFFRAWLWLTTGINTKAWTAVHRKHHAKCETKEDPHSPQVLGISKVLWQGAELYKIEAKNSETLKRYGQGTPDDWLENHIYTPHSNKGYLIMLFINLVLFGFPGITMWALQMMLIPFFAAGVINGLGHYWGYRNFDCPDASTNLFPIGILIGGEELHNNHHAFPTSAQFSTKWWEFDIGWFYIRLLSLLGLAKIKRRIPKVIINNRKQRIDIDSLSAIIKNRYQILATYKSTVVLPVFNKAKLALNAFNIQSTQQKNGKKSAYADLRIVYRLKKQFQEIWTMTTANNNEILEQLHKWCIKAETANISQLKKFVMYIRGCT
jgi:stearoyl-CoA desaturase (delta-9 desaturase)